MSYERLSAQDTLFLHIEDPDQPQHVGALALFEAGPFHGPDGRFRIDAVRRHVADRLHLVPRFRKRLMPVPLQQGRPVWVDDPSFDLAYHVRLTALPTPGDEELLLALMGRLQGQVLDRRRPLWELWFVEGVEGDRVALIQKTHHALVDGISGIDVATVLLDLERRAPRSRRRRGSPSPPPARPSCSPRAWWSGPPSPPSWPAPRAPRSGSRPGSSSGDRPRPDRGEDGEQRAGHAVERPVRPHRRFHPARVPLDRSRPSAPPCPG
jgi:diacylglycerol O-acyltransferase / wax synthase